MHSSDNHEIDSGAAQPLSLVLAEICRHPKRYLVDSWNWKAAALSVLFRAPVFLITTRRHGLQVMAAAGVVESVFRILITGIDASITQAVERAKPQWMVALVVLAAIPGWTVGLEAIVHWLAGTPNLRAGLAVSLVLSLLSSGFNWFSMRRGTLLVGREASSFATDLARIPMLIVRFVAGPVVILRSSLSGLSNSTQEKTPELFTEIKPIPGGLSRLPKAADPNTL